MGRPYDLRRWRRLRLAQLKREPLCRLCAAANLTIPATDVDHIVPLAGGGAFDDLANLRSLCHACHSRVTRAWIAGQPEPRAKVQTVDPTSGLPIDPEHWWSK